LITHGVTHAAVGIRKSVFQLSELGGREFFHLSSNINKDSSFEFGDFGAALDFINFVYHNNTSYILEWPIQLNLVILNVSIESRGRFRLTWRAVLICIGWEKELCTTAAGSRDCETIYDEWATIVPWDGAIEAIVLVDVDG